MFTLADYIPPLRAEIPLHVVSDQAFERILNLTEQFSSTLANQIFSFEIRLHGGLPHVDYLMRISATNLMHLFDCGSSKNLSEHMAAHPAWQKVYRLALLCNDPGSPLHRELDHIWLEFDLDRPVMDIPVPDLFYYQPNSTDPLPTILALADIFYGPSKETIPLASLTRCLDNIPPGSSIHQVGFGLRRNCDAIRLQVLGLATQDIPDYLAAIGWPYTTSPLEPLLNLISHYDLRSVMVDIGRQPKPKIGIEGFFTEYGNTLQQWLDELVKQGWCDPMKRNFLSTFPGFKVHHVTNQVSITEQRPSHIKFSYEPDRSLKQVEAKTYLIFCPYWYSATADIAATN